MQPLQATKLQLWILWLIFPLLHLFGTSATSQTILPLSPILADAEREQPDTINFQLLNAGGTVRWHYENLSAIPFIFLGIDTMGILAKQGRLAFEANPSITSGTLFRFRAFGVFDDGTGPDTVSKAFVLPILSSIPSPCSTRVKIALVLDASGSMNRGTTGSDTRWTELHSAVMSYLPSLRDRVQPSDSLRVSVFQGTSQTELFEGRFDEINWDNREEVENQVFGATIPDSSTPMGSGVLQAVNDLPNLSTDSRELIILFSDGYQNVDPYFIIRSMPDGRSICDTDWDTVSGMRQCSEPGTELDGHGNGIRIFTIGVGGADEGLLRDLANPTDAFAFATNTNDMDLFFAQTIPEAFRGCSPRILDFRRGTLMGKDSVLVEKFMTDSLVEDLSIQLKVKNPNAAISDDIALFKDGELIPIQPTFSGPDVRYFIELPYQLDTNLFLDGGGEWEVRFSGTAKATYEVIAMVEDRYLKTNVRVRDVSSLHAGDAVEAVAQIQLFDLPVEEAEITATLLRPGEDLGDLVARTDFNGSPTLLENTAISGLSQSSLLGRAKLQALLERPSFSTQLRGIPRSLPMTHIGNGQYRATFSGNENLVSGTYKLMVKFKGELPGLGPYEGLELRWAYLDFARPDDIALNIDLTGQDPSMSNDSDYHLRFRPANQFGKFFGPGKAHRMRALVGSKALVLEDELDGRYSAAFSPPPGKDPKISIYVIDQDKPVLEKRLSSFLRTFSLSLHGGYARSFSSVNPLSAGDQGPAFEFDLAYSFNRNWAVSIVGGQYELHSNFAFQGGLLHGEYSFRRDLPGATGRPFLRMAAGLGVLKPESQDLAFAMGIRPALVYEISKALDISLDASLLYMPSPDYVVGYAGIGLRYYF